MKKVRNVLMVKNMLLKKNWMKWTRMMILSWLWINLLNEFYRLIKIKEGDMESLMTLCVTLGTLFLFLNKTQRSVSYIQNILLISVTLEGLMLVTLVMGSLFIHDSIPVLMGLVENSITIMQLSLGIGIKLCFMMIFFKFSEIINPIF